jgi:hypothetical protein
MNDWGCEMKLRVTLEPDGYFHAIDLDSYEGESDSVGSWSKSLVGYGKTKWRAIFDLLTEMDEAGRA